MKVEYENTTQDLLEFYSCYFKNSPTLKRKRRRIAVLGFLLWQCVMSTVILLLSLSGREAPAIEIFCFGNIFGIFLWPVIFKEGIKISLLSQAKKGNMSCRQLVEINEKGFSKTVNRSKYHVSWSDVIELDIIDVFMWFGARYV